MLHISLLMLAMAPMVPTGEATIRTKAGPSEIIVVTTSRLAGAVHSITWNGKEFIDSLDHGRQLQSACAFDCGKKPFWAECYNPTEAGSRKDHTGKTSSSNLLEFKSAEASLESRNRMAFWLNPGEKSSGRPALNDTPLSDHILSKKLTLNYRGLAHAMEYDATFTIPKGEHHTLAQFEAVTGYMPPGFSSFHTFDVRTHELASLSDGPGEQAKPVILSTPDGSHAMGVLAIGETPKGASGPSYGRWKFTAEKVVKWNCVYRVKAEDGVPPGDYRFRMAVVVGSRENVRVTMVQLLKP